MKVVLSPMNFSMEPKGKSIEFHIKEIAKEEVNEPIVVEFPSFSAFAKELFRLANEVWPGIEPKEANSDASDYYEYYDKEFDNNGYLSFDYGKSRITVDQVEYYESRVYKFNKRKMQSFLFDLIKEREAE